MFGRMANTLRGLVGLILGIGRPAASEQLPPPPTRTVVVPAAAAVPRTQAVALSTVRPAAGFVPTAADGEWPDLLMDSPRCDPQPRASRPAPQVVFAGCGTDETDLFSLDLCLPGADR